MVFLAPAAGLVGAALAVPALLVLYLLKLRRRPLRVSSTFLWDQVVRDEQANVPLRWLQASWPLVIQLLALLCLLAAIARPAIPADSTIAGRVVLVIDRTASMSAQDAPPTPAGVSGAARQSTRTRLDQAKAEALRVVDDLMRASGGVRPEAMVIAVGAEARVAAGLTSDLRMLREAIAGIDPSDQAGDAGWEAAAGLVRAATGIGARGDDAFEGGPSGASGNTPTVAALRPPINTDVLVFSDGGLDDFASPRLSGRGVSTRFVRCGAQPPDAPGAQRPDNLGIVAINARRDAETPATVRVFVRLVNSGPQEVAAALRATINDERVGTLALTVPAAGRDANAVPGEAAGTIEFDNSAGGVLVLSLLRDDLLAADNAAAMVLSPVRPARVLVVGPGDAQPDDPYAALRGEQGVDRLLLSALRELGLAELRTVSAAVYEAGSAGDDDWKRFDLVVFDRVKPRMMPRHPSLSFGAGISAAGNSGAPGIVVEPLGTGSSAGTSTRFISWQRSHPLLRGIPLEAVLASPPMRMTLPPDNEAGEAARTRITPLAFGLDGPLIVQVEDPGAGGARRVVVAFDLLNTNWGKDVSFPIFVATAVEYLTGRGESASGHFATTQESVTVRAAPDVRSVKAVGPATMLAEVGDAGTAALGVPERVGVYAVEGAIDADRVLAVNLVDARESALGGRGLTTAASSPRSAAGPAEPAPGRIEERGVREIWHWFVLLAAGLLTFEWFVYASRIRV